MTDAIAFLVVVLALLFGGVCLWVGICAEHDRVQQQRQDAALVRHHQARQLQVAQERARIATELARQKAELDYELAMERLRQIGGGR